MHVSAWLLYFYCMMILMRPRKKLQRGFAVVPVIILVALIGLMVPTVKHVTDPEANFDSRGFAQVMIDGVVGAIPKKKKTQPKPVVEKDPVTIEDIQEAKVKREEEEEAPLPAPEEVDPTPSQTEVQEEELDIGEVDDELFSVLDQQAQESIVKEVLEEKEAGEEAASQEAYDKLSDSGYLLENDKAQYEKEKEMPASSADQAVADRWAGYSENQITGQEAYDQAEEGISTYTYTTTQSPDVTEEGQAALSEAMTYSVGTKVVDGQITTVPVYDPNGTLTYQEALAAIGQVAVSDTYQPGQEVGCASLTGQEREGCFTALEQETLDQLRLSEEALIAIGRGFNAITYGAGGDMIAKQIEKNKEYGFGTDNYNYWQRVTDLESVGSTVAPAFILASETLMLGHGISAVAGSSSVIGAATSLATSPQFAFYQSANTMTSSGYQATQFCDENSDSYNQGDCTREVSNIVTATVDIVADPLIKIIDTHVWLGGNPNAKSINPNRLSFSKGARLFQELLAKQELVQDTYGVIDTKYFSIKF